MSTLLGGPDDCDEDEWVADFVEAASRGNADGFWDRDDADILADLTALVWRGHELYDAWHGDGGADEMYGDDMEDMYAESDDDDDDDDGDEIPKDWWS